ncbi:MAG: hypothetical protein M0Z38_02335 [Deltaproteobacteria bacterium]|nr:hypothetical protein [Deltaproteobacteria bacterium]
MPFEYRNADHSYWLDDRRLETVTEILERSGIADYRFSNEDAMLRGTYVHRATEMIDRGTLDWAALDPVLVPYCEAYQRFVEDKRPVILMSEKPMYHPQYLFAGTPDRVMEMDGDIILPDLKSGAPNRATVIQTSTYRELVEVSEGIKCRKCFSLHLKDTGKYQLSAPVSLMDAKRYFNIFLAALTVERYKKEAA